MSDRSTLERKPGTLSGRIIPQNWSAPEGTHVFCLGSDVPGYTGRFANGDFANTGTGGTIGVDSVATLRARIRGPLGELPAGWSWQAVVYAPGTTAVGVVIPITPGMLYDMPDLAVPLMAGDGPTGVGVLLQVVGPGGGVVEELEIPAFYFDSFVVAPVPAGLGIYNRFPANGAVEVARDTKVSFYLISTTGTAPDLAATDVYVGGVPVLLAGVSQPGYVVTTSPLGAGTLIVQVEPSTPFESQQLVDVRVVSTLGATVIDQSWSFTCADETAPRVLSASSPTHDTVRVRFDEPVKMTDAADSDDALNPANWTVTPTTAPAVTVDVVSVSIVSPFEVDLVVDIPLTQGATYEVVATGIVDLHGNVIEAPLNRATFDGYECPRPEGRRFELWRMVSDMDRRRDETRDLYKFLSVLQEPTDLLLCDIDRWVEIIDVDVAEERYVDQMLITLGNPFSFDLDLVDKRRLVRTLIRVYQQKGTAVGIINVIRFFLGLEVTIDAYNQDGWILGEDELGVGTYLASSESFAKYAFIVVSPIVLTEEQRDRIDQLVDYMKPAHTHHVATTEPEAVEETTEWWILGDSQLGVDTILFAPTIPSTFDYLTSGGDYVTSGGGKVIIP